MKIGVKKFGDRMMIGGLVSLLAFVYLIFIIETDISIGWLVFFHILLVLAATSVKFGYILRLIGGDSEGK